MLATTALVLLVATFQLSAGQQTAKANVRFAMKDSGGRFVSRVDNGFIEAVWEPQFPVASSFLQLIESNDGTYSIRADSELYLVHIPGIDTIQAIGNHPSEASKFLLEHLGDGVVAFRLEASRLYLTVVERENRFAVEVSDVEPVADENARFTITQFRMFANVDYFKQQ